MKIPSHVLLPVLIVLTLAVPTVSGADGSCRHLTLQPTPTWTFSGTWSPDGRLLLVDVGKKAVWAYDPASGIGESVWASGDRLDQPGGPALIQTRDDTVLLEVHDTLQLLTPEGWTAAPWAHLADVEGLAGLRNVHSWTAGTEHILLYGDHYHPVAGWRPVLAVAPVDDPSRLRILETLSFDGSDRTFYTTSQDFLAVSGPKGYALTLAPRPHVLEIDLESGERRRLPLPAVLSPRVELPPASGLDTMTLQQAALASTHRPAAIYAYDGLLYILSRHPRSESPWRLTSYDPEGGQAVSATVLPTKADHVVLIPGKRWALIEKGPFEGYGRQEILGVWILPASQVTRGGHACRRVGLALP